MPILTVWRLSLLTDGVYSLNLVDGVATVVELFGHYPTEDEVNSALERHREAQIDASVSSEDLQAQAVASNEEVHSLVAYVARLESE